LLQPLQELAQIEKELSKADKNVLKELAFAYIGGWNSIVTAWGKLTGKVPTNKDRIENINQKFIGLKEKAAQVGRYLFEKYNVELHLARWDITPIIKSE
jgi:hypothetical protein